MRIIYFINVLLLLIYIYEKPVYSETNEEGDNDDHEVSDSGDDLEEENDVLILKENNFDSQINSHDIILVEFYAPWCGHCKQLAPEYERAAKRLKSATPPVPLAKVDATVETALAAKYEIQGYPTLKWFKNGIPYEYEGPRDENGIVEYMKEHSDPTWKPPPEAVIVLTKENFTEVTEREELSIVMFYAPWCGHCKRLSPEYEKAAQELKKTYRHVPLAKVDATVETELASKYDVQGYPTLKVFRKGHAYNFNGETRDKHSLMVYIESQIGAASKEYNNLDAVKKIMPTSELPVRIIAFFESANDPTFQSYVQSSDELRDEYWFAHTFDAQTQQHYQIHPGSVVIFISERYHTPYEPKRHVLQLKADTKPSEITKFIRKHDLPLVAEYNHNTKDKLFKMRPIILFFYTIDWSFEHRDATQKWRIKFADIARQFVGKITFAIADEENFGPLVREFGLDDSGEEINIGILGEKDKKYPMKPMDEFDAEEVSEFINNFLKGKLKPRIKSQPVPKKQSGPVTVVVGSTFEKIVLDDKKDVLIELYAPWCGHCKKLEPIYTELAKKLKKEKNLVIAKMDATANDAPESFEASGYPTIYFAPAGQKKAPVQFSSGERNAEELEKFMRKHAVVSFGGKKAKEEL